MKRIFFKRKKGNNINKDIDNWKENCFPKFNISIALGKLRVGRAFKSLGQMYHPPVSTLYAFFFFPN